MRACSSISRLSSDPKWLVYVLDDNPSVAAAVAAYLDSDEFDTKAFSDPLELMRAVLTSRPHAVISDLRFETDATAGDLHAVVAHVPGMEDVYRKVRRTFRVRDEDPVNGRHVLVVVGFLGVGAFALSNTWQGPEDEGCLREFPGVLLSVEKNTSDAIFAATPLRAAGVANELEWVVGLAVEYTTSRGHE